MTDDISLRDSATPPETLAQPLTQNPPRRVLLLVNHHSRQGRTRAHQAADYLRSLGLEVFEETSETPEQISPLIVSYRQRVDGAVIGGGDGTLNAAIAGLLETQLPLGILPLGTANDLARTLSIPLNIIAACNVIAQGRTQRIDLGQVNDRYFFNVASLGLSVQITEQLSGDAKRRWGVLAYLATALRVLWRARPFRAEICVNGEFIRVKTIQIAVGNGRHYGGGMTVAHDATIHDQRLDLYSLELQHWWQVLALFPALYHGHHPKWMGVRLLHAQELEVHTRRPRSINTDGEIVTSTPAHFRVLPRSLPVWVP